MNNQALRIFTEAMEQSEDTRDDWLITACDGDAELIATVQKLMHADVAASSLLPTGGAWSDAAQLQPGQIIGSYRVLEQIGAGGMGTVYKAERSDGAFQRTVAIKLVSQSAMSDETRSRFLNERQILAHLQHPNIAALLDGGTEGETAYLVMEYIEGSALDYDDQRAARDTLELFINVCDAVQHAHNNLVLHRDLKPSNVLLSADGEVKLLDFGVAKITQTISEASNQDLTGLDPAPLTLNFAAPERLEGKTATIASDVYSLGVYLHRLLRGTQPYDVHGQSFVAAHAKIMNRSLANTKPADDLDLIIATAMHPDPDRRYASVAALRNDVRLCLDNRAIQARGDDWRYLLKKVVGQYRYAIMSAGVGVVLLVGALGFSLYQAKIADEQRIRAESTTKFLGSVFTSIDPYSGDMLGPDANLKQLLAASEQYIDEEFAEDPEGRTRVFTLFGFVYSALQMIDASKRMVGEAENTIATYALEDGANAAALLQIRINNAQASGDIAKASAACDELLSQRSVLDADILTKFNSLIPCAQIRQLEGQREQAKALGDEALQLYREQGEAFSKTSSVTMLPELANVFFAVGDQELSIELVDEAIAIGEEIGTTAYAALANLYLAKSIPPNQVGDVQTSLKYTALALQTAEKSQLARDSLRFAYTQLYHADRLIDADQLEEAAAVFAPARQVLLQNNLEFSPFRSLVYFTDYKLAYKQGDFERAAASIQESRRIRESSGEAYGQWLAATDHALGKTYVQMGRYAEAVPLLRRAYEFYLDLFGAEHERVKLYREVLDQATAGLVATDD